MHPLFIESAKLAADNFLGLRPFSQKHFVGGGSSGESGVIVMVLKIEQIWQKGYKKMTFFVFLNLHAWELHQVLSAFFNKIGFFLVVSSEKIETVLSFFVVEQFWKEK